MRPLKAPYNRDRKPKSWVGFLGRGSKLLPKELRVLGSIESSSVRLGAALRMASPDTIGLILLIVDHTKMKYLYPVQCLVCYCDLVMLQCILYNVFLVYEIRLFTVGKSKEMV